MKSHVPFGGPRRLSVLTLGAVVAFAFITALYRSGVTKPFDRAVQQQVRALDGGWLQPLGYMDDLIFRSTPTFVAALIVALVLWRIGPRWSWCVPLAISFAVLAEAIVKNGFGQVLHPRALLDGFLVLFGGHYHAPAAFPSGHVTRALFLAVVGLAYFPRALSIPFALLALTTPLARMYTETHRLTDALGGAALGTSVALAAICAATILATLEARYRRSSRPIALVRWLGAWSAT